MSLPDAVAPVPPSPPAQGRFIAFRSRDFRLLLAGQAGSLTGSPMQQGAGGGEVCQPDPSPPSLGVARPFPIRPVPPLALGGGGGGGPPRRRRGGRGWQ